MDSVHTSNVIPIATLRAVDRGDPAGGEGCGGDPSRRGVGDGVGGDARNDRSDGEAGDRRRGDAGTGSPGPEVDDRRRDLQLIALALQLTDSDDDETLCLRSVFARLLDDVDVADEVPVSES